MASTVHELASGVPHDAAKHLSGHDREQRLVPMSKGCRRVERAHETRGTEIALRNVLVLDLDS